MQKKLLRENVLFVRYVTTTLRINFSSVFNLNFALKSGFNFCINKTLSFVLFRVFKFFNNMFNDIKRI